MDWELVALFFLVAFIYSTGGFGGGSSYLAILTFWSFDFSFLRTTALLCNIAVVGGNAFVYLKNQLLHLHKIVWLLAFSVPLAFLGGVVKIEEKPFFLLLGLSLSAAGILMIFEKKWAAQNPIKVKNSNTLMAGLGGGIGLLSGMVGIGGGIFLSPILHLMRWETPKTIAATTNFFILVNSLAGLAGQLIQANFGFDVERAFPLLLGVFIGGQIGSRLAVKKFSNAWVRYAAAALILYVGVSLLIKLI